MPLIQFHDIFKSYGDKSILQKFQLEIERGEFVTVVGSSGCGKTTVLKMINGLQKPDQGKVLIDGQDISELDQNKLRRQIGYVIQNTGLFPHMKVRDNIAYVPRLLGLDKQTINHRINRLIERMDLDKKILTRYPHTLTRGQKQRVGIARALISKPKILLMDEPFTTVDKLTRKNLQNQIKQIQEELDITVLYITHDIKEALHLGTKVIVMNHGKIEQFDTAEEIWNRPKTEFVERLVGNKKEAPIWGMTEFSEKMTELNTAAQSHVIWGITDTD